MNQARPTKKQPSFGEAFSELERITDDLESDTLDLDKAIEKFEHGLELAQQLKTKLSAVEQRVEKIRQRFDAAALPTDEDRAEGAED